MNNNYWFKFLEQLIINWVIALILFLIFWALGMFLLGEIYEPSIDYFIIRGYIIASLIISLFLAAGEE